MDAVKFLEERKRMFKSGKAVPNLGVDVTYNSEKVVKIVEVWSAAHPRKTRQSVFLEQWPNCMIDNDGVVGICPRNVNNKCICDLERFYDCRVCQVCRREFWSQEVE